MQTLRKCSSGFSSNLWAGRGYDRCGCGAEPGSAPAGRRGRRDLVRHRPPQHGPPVASPPPAWPTAGSWQRRARRARLPGLSGQRRDLRSDCRDLGHYRLPQHGPRRTYGHLAARRPGPGGGGIGGSAATIWPAPSVSTRLLGPGAAPAPSAPPAARPYGYPAGRRPGPGGGGTVIGRLPGQRRALRPGRGHLGRHRLPGHRPLMATPPPCWPTAGSWWRGDLMMAKTARQRRALQPGHRDLVRAPAPWLPPAAATRPPC